MPTDDPPADALRAPPRERTHRRLFFSACGGTRVWANANTKAFFSQVADTAWLAPTCAYPAHLPMCAPLLGLQAPGGLVTDKTVSTVMANAGALPHLTSLGLTIGGATGALTGEGVQIMFTQFSLLQNLEALQVDVGHSGVATCLGDVGQAVATSRLKQFVFAINNLYPAGPLVDDTQVNELARGLAQAKFLEQLSLDLSGSTIGNQGMLALMTAAAGLPELVELTTTLKSPNATTSPAGVASAVSALNKRARHPQFTWSADITGFPGAYKDLADAVACFQPSSSVAVSIGVYSFSQEFNPGPNPVECTYTGVVRGACPGGLKYVETIDNTGACSSPHPSFCATCPAPTTLLDQ